LNRVTAHAHRQAFLEAAVLATIAMVFGHFAVFAPAARVAQLLADGSLEESFASLAADGTVVTTRRSIAAHDAVLDGQGHGSASRFFRCDQTDWRNRGRSLHLHRHPARRSARAVAQHSDDGRRINLTISEEVAIRFRRLLLGEHHLSESFSINPLTHSRTHYNTNLHNAELFFFKNKFSDGCNNGHEKNGNE